MASITKKLKEMKTVGILKWGITPFFQDVDKAVHETAKLIANIDAFLLLTYRVERAKQEDAAANQNNR